jgi:dTDP-4-amino-4,6-dideoxygalactose transaminase
MAPDAEQIPFFGVEREYRAHRAEYLSAIEDVLETGQVLQGPAVTALEEKLVGLTGRKHAVAVNSCTDALFFALKAAGVGPGDEVLVPDFTFLASATGILRSGATPVFIDVREDDLLMDLNVAETLVTNATKAIIFVGLFGLVHSIQTVQRFVEQHDLALIEDAAQSFGAEVGDVTAGSIGWSSCLSFDPTKVISAPGSGGAYLTDDDEAAGMVRAMRYHGRMPSGSHEILGYNSQMPSITAAMLSVKLDHNPVWTHRRQEIAGSYVEAFQHIPEIDVISPKQGGAHVFHKFVMRAATRDDLKQHLTANNVQSRIHYETPLHGEPVFASSIPAGAQFPVADRASEEVISLPIHPFLTDDEVDSVIRRVQEFYGSA